MRRIAGKVRLRIRRPPSRAFMATPSRRKTTSFRRKSILTWNGSGRGQALSHGRPSSPFTKAVNPPRPRSTLLDPFRQEVAAPAVLDLHHPDIPVPPPRAFDIGVEVGLPVGGRGLHPDALAVQPGGLGIEPGGPLPAG